ncbi:unnamed protein product [Prunus armeniaca]|uniref:Uncharacterized protein n=1 Tax=Prunus armeniaca TaxID=36596 RepID=A0A6J5UU05_PRUAR|nr:unnamed protein product [Prunus armeniaca]
MTKSIREGSGSLNKPAFCTGLSLSLSGIVGGKVKTLGSEGSKGNGSVHLTQEYVEQVPNIGTVEVPVKLAGNVINEEGNEEENSEEESIEEDTDIDGIRRRLEFEDSVDESDKKIYESDNDAALDDNNEFDVNLQFNFGRVRNTYLPKDFVPAACEEDSGTNSE